MDPQTVRFISIDEHPSTSDALERSTKDDDDVEMVGSFVSIASVPKPLRSAWQLIDPAVMDLNLPGVTGFEAVETVTGGGLPALVLSANTRPREWLHWGRRVGVRVEGAADLAGPRRHPPASR